jgi:hypothetical protein
MDCFMKSYWIHVLIGMIWVGRLFGQIPEEVVKRERAVKAEELFDEFIRKEE